MFNLELHVTMVDVSRISLKTLEMHGNPYTPKYSHGTPAKKQKMNQPLGLEHLAFKKNGIFHPIKAVDTRPLVIFFKAIHLRTPCPGA